MHYVGYAFICSKIVVETVPPGFADSGFLSSAPPVEHVMTGPQSGMRTEVVGVNFAAVASHCFCHTINEFVACAQELIPEHSRTAKFSVVPGIAAYVIAPFLTTAVVCMHHISIIEESVPVVAMYLVVVELHQSVDGCLDKAVARIFNCWQTPNAESTFAVQVFRSADELCVGFDTSVDADEHFRCATYSPCCTHAWLYIFVSCLESMGNCVVVCKIEWFCLRRIKAECNGCCVAASSLNKKCGWETLPEIAQTERCQPLWIANRYDAVVAVSFLSTYPRTIMCGTFADSITV